MRFVVTLICSQVLLVSLSWGALPSDAHNATSFFRAKRSLFSSGQAPRQALAQNIIRKETEDQFRIRWNEKDYLVHADHLVRDIHMSRFVTLREKSPLYSTPLLKSPQKALFAANAQLEILQIKSDFAYVQNLNKSLQGWMPLGVLGTRHDDPGILLSSENIKVRKQPSESALVIGELQPLTRVIPLEISSHYVKFIFGTQTVYAPVEKFISRSDFAVMAYHPKVKWKNIRTRQNHLVLTQDQQTLLLDEIKGYVTDSKKAVYLRTPARNLDVINHVQIIAPHTEIWTLSFVKGHGEVWWKESTERSPQSTPRSKGRIQTDDLLQRKIHSIAFSPSNPNVGLASASGIYRTEDGQNWTRIDSFKDENLPVAIHPNGTWFAGHYRSTNKGKSFEPFIRWDKLAKTIQLNTQINPQQIKITDIQPLAQSRIQLEVDTGAKKIKLKSLIGDLHWEVVR